MKQIKKESNRTYSNFSNEVNKNIKNVIIIKDNNKINNYRVNKNIKFNKKSNKNYSFINQYNAKDDKKKKNITLLSQNNFFMLVIIFFLFNINEILCESYIIVKINKAGRHQILYNGVFEKTDHGCNTDPNLPTRMTINEHEIESPTVEYNFTEQVNTIKLYYEDSKDDFKCLFYGCSDINEIDASNLNTSNVNNMKYMFYKCSSLTSLNINNFNTKKVISMRAMFEFCSSLTSIDVSSFITSSLTDMAYMFEGCSKLSSLNLSNFETSNVSFMDYLFKGCSSLTTLDISNFRTSKVTWMSNMFKDCFLITTLDLSNFITSSVNYFHSMFEGCKSLTSLNLSNFNTEKANKMNGMFNGCYNLKYLDIHNFDTSLVIDMSFIFNDCSSLESLDIINFNTSNVGNMYKMFGNCSSLTTLDLTHFDVSYVTNVGWMFYQCRNLTYLNLSNFNFKLTTEFDYMFNGCKSLKILDFTQFKIDNARNVRAMFRCCSSLTSIDLNNLNTSNVILMTEMFLECSSLESLDLSNFNTSKVTDMSQMFQNCENLKFLNLNNFNTLNVENMGKMFSECYKLESLDISSFRTPNVKSMASMFVRCKSLITLDVSQFDTSLITDTSNMFRDCSLITSLDLSQFTTSSIKNMNSMFLNSNKLTSLNLSHFDFTQVTDIKHMFSGCLKLKYINIKSLIINNGTGYTNFIDNNLINPIICIDDMASLNKIISLYNCHQSYNSENWGLYKDDIVNDNNMFINNCLLSKYDTKCYKICSFYYYYDERLNKYICTEDLKCPEPYDKLIHGKNECIKSCDETNDYKYELTLGKVCLANCYDSNFNEPYDSPFSCIPKCPQENPFLLVESLECTSYCTIKQRQDKLCVTYYIQSKEVNYQIFDKVISQTRNELLNSFDASVVNGGIINENGDNITITRTEKENLNDDGIYLGVCEERLKNHYNISQNESLYVLRLDIRQIGYQQPSLEYEILYPIYNSTKLVILDLSICDGININRNIYADISGNIDKYDKNSGYYNDICYITDSDNGVDMTLKDKKDEFINNNLGVCEDGCKLASYDNVTKKAVCSCSIKKEIHLMNEIKVDKESLLNSFTNIENIANIKFLKCYKIVFQKKYIIKNIGFYIFACLIILDLFCILYFVIKDYTTLIKEIKKISYYFLNKNKTKINNIETNHIKKNIKQKMKKSGLTNNIKDKKLSKKILDNKRLKNNGKQLELLLNKETITPQLNNQKTKFKKINNKISKKIIGLPKNSIIKGKNNVSNSNKSYNFFVVDNNINFGKKSTKLIKSIHFIKLNYNEMNSLPFKDAIIKDKRNFIQYYASLLKTKHSLIYIFYNEDYNSKIAKFSVQIFDLATLIATNALFFNDSTMHKIYTDHGAFDFLYQLPQFKLVNSIIRIN